MADNIEKSVIDAINAIRPALQNTNGVQRYIRETVDPEITVINDNQI